MVTHNFHPEVKISSRCLILHRGEFNFSLLCEQLQEVWPETEVSSPRGSFAPAQNLVNMPVCLSFGHVLWSRDLRFKRYIRTVFRLICYSSWRYNFPSWLTTLNIKNEYFKNWAWLFHETKKCLNWPFKYYFFRSCHFLADSRIWTK